MVDRHTNTHTETKLKYFNGHGRLSQSEESEYMRAHHKDGVTRVFERCQQGVARGMDGGKSPHTHIKKTYSVNLVKSCSS